MDLYQLNTGLLIRRFSISKVAPPPTMRFVVLGDQILICNTSKSDPPLVLQLWSVQKGECVHEVKCTNSSKKGNKIKKSNKNKKNNQNSKNSSHIDFYAGCFASISPESDSSSPSISREHIFVVGEGVRIRKRWCFSQTENLKSRLVIARVTSPKTTNSNDANSKCSDYGFNSSGMLFNNGHAHNSSVQTLIARPDGTILSVSFDMTVKLWRANGSLLKRLPSDNIHFKSIVPLSDDHSVYAVLYTSDIGLNTVGFLHLNDADNYAVRLEASRTFSYIIDALYWWKSRRLLVLCRQGENQLEVWKLDEQYSMTHVQDFRNEALDFTYIASVTLLENRDLILAGTNLGVIKVWDMATSKLLFNMNEDNTASVDVLLQVGEDTVASYQADGCVSIFDLTLNNHNYDNKSQYQTQRRLRSWTHPGVSQSYENRCMVLLSGNQLCTTRHNNVRIWDLQGCCLSSITFPLPGKVTSATSLVERADRSIVIGFSGGTMVLYRRAFR